MKQKPTKKCENGVQLRPASIEEAGLFYSELDEKQDEALGTVGHIRMDFGSGGKEFWHTWWPHNKDRFNTPEFKAELQEIVDILRAEGLLKNLSSMSTAIKMEESLPRMAEITGILQKQTTTATVSAVPPLREIIRATYTAMISGSRKWPKRTR